MTPLSMVQYCGTPENRGFTLEGPATLTYLRPANMVGMVIGLTGANGCADVGLPLESAVAYVTAAPKLVLPADRVLLAAQALFTAIEDIGCDPKELYRAKLLVENHLSDGNDGHEAVAEALAKMLQCEVDSAQNTLVERGEIDQGPPMWHP